MRLIEQVGAYRVVIWKRQLKLIEMAFVMYTKHLQSVWLQEDWSLAYP